MRYVVVIPWHGVKKGDVVQTDKLHPALLPNVKPAPAPEPVADKAKPKKV